MSREYQQLLDSVHEDITRKFVAAETPAERHVECRIDDMIYVYLYVDGVHIQTQHVDIPDRWMDRGWPTDATVRRHIRRYADIGRARITTLKA